MNMIKNRLKTITLANSAIASIGQVLETHTVDEYIAGGLLDGLRVLTWAISQEVEIIEGITVPE
jgi:hypothetical protein